MPKMDDIMAQLETAKIDTVIAKLKAREDDLFNFVFEEFCKEVGVELYGVEFLMSVYYAKTIEDFVGYAFNLLGYDTPVEEERRGSPEEYPSKVIHEYAGGFCRHLQIEGIHLFWICISCEAAIGNIRIQGEGLEKILTKGLIHEFVHVCEYLSGKQLMKFSLDLLDKVSERIYAKWKSREE
jgi:hypothetical protein